MLAAALVSNLISASRSRSFITSIIFVEKISKLIHHSAAKLLHINDSNSPTVVTCNVMAYADRY